jgi:predicted CopG family antitoxin
MSQELDRKHMQVSLQVYDTLTSLKRGNMTYSDVIVSLLEKAGIELVEVK